MAREKLSQQSFPSLNDSPFANLNIQFSADEMQAFEKEKAHSGESPFPGGVVKVRLEKKGRGGKTVTVFYDFEKQQGESLEKILFELKKILGTGGKIEEGNLELQGDQRLKSVEWLKLKGYKVKGEIK